MFLKLTRFSPSIQGHSRWVVATARGVACRGYWCRAGGEKLFCMIFLTRVQVNIYDRTRAHKIEHIF
nr:MAG TPA: hypothetical protein [Caudoviricetes sp.]